MSKRAYQIIIALLSIALLVSCLRSPSPKKPIGSSNPAVVTAGNSGNGSGYGSGSNAGSNSGSSYGGSKSTRASSNDAPIGDTIAVSALPPEGQAVLKKIQNRESFPYRQDGQVFSNREGVLPNQARGYYQEYTVPTPGADNRGARRIVSGQGSTGDAATSGEYYYTQDHYRSFARIRLN